MSRRRALPRAAVLAAAAALLVAGCTSSGYQYLKSSGDKTYFKVPDSWKVYDEETLLGHGNLTAEERDAARQASWQVAFDASPHPSLRHVNDLATSHPVGYALVRALSGAEADEISNAGLRNFFFGVDDALKAGTAQVLDYENLVLDGGFHGNRTVLRIMGEKSTVIVNQTAIVDQATSKVYTLLVGCRADCYDKYQDKIDTVVRSWTVRES